MDRGRWWWFQVATTMYAVWFGLLFASFFLLLVVLMRQFLAGEGSAFKETAKEKYMLSGKTLKRQPMESSRALDYFIMGRLSWDRDSQAVHESDVSLSEQQYQNNCKQRFKYLADYKNSIQMKIIAAKMCILRYLLHIRVVARPGERQSTLGESRLLPHIPQMICFHYAASLYGSKPVPAVDKIPIIDPLQTNPDWIAEVVPPRCPDQIHKLIIKVKYTCKEEKSKKD